MRRAARPARPSAWPWHCPAHAPSPTAPTRPAPTLPGVLLAWRFDPLALAADRSPPAAYLWAVRRVNRAHPANRHPRLSVAGCSSAGWPPSASRCSRRSRPTRARCSACTWSSTCSSSSSPRPLLLAGAPITLALRAASPSVRRGCWRSSTAGSSTSLSFPVIAWLLFAAVNWGWHFSALYDQALENPAPPLPPARDLPGGRAPLLVAGHRRRPVAVAAAAPGAPLLPLPGHAAELVPRRGAMSAPRRPLPALRDERCAPGAHRRSRTRSWAA